MEIVDLTKVYKKYKGQWVVFDKNGTVIAANRNLKGAIARFKEKRPKAIPDVLKVPTKLTPYVGPTGK